MRTKTIVVPLAAIMAIGAPVAGYAATESPASGPEIEIEDFAFAPKRKVVKPGVLVTWKNRDSVPHNAAATKKVNGKRVFKTKTGRLNAVLTAKAPKTVGTYAYICTVHPQMKGTLVVRK